MGIKNVFPITTGLCSIEPSWIYIDTEDSTATVLTANYLSSSKDVYGSIYSNKQMALVSVIDSGVTGVMVAEVIVSTVVVVAVVRPAIVNRLLVSSQPKSDSDVIFCAAVKNAI